MEFSSQSTGVGSFSLLQGIFPVQFSLSVMSDSLWPHGLQHAEPPCPSPTPGVYSNSCSLSQWCHPTISSSVIPFSCLQSLPASGSFQMSQFFASGGQSQFFASGLTGAGGSTSKTACSHSCEQEASFTHHGVLPREWLQCSHEHQSAAGSSWASDPGEQGGNCKVSCDQASVVTLSLLQCLIGYIGRPSPGWEKTAHGWRLGYLVAAA